MVVNPAWLIAGASLLLATLTALVTVVWKLSTIASTLSHTVDRVAKVESKNEAHDEHTAHLAVIEQRLDHKRERITALEVRITRLEDRHPTGSHAAVR